MFTSSTNPVVLRLHGRVPALKNSKEIVSGKDGKALVRASRDVELFYQKNRLSLRSQWEEQQAKGHKILKMPIKVYVFALIYTFIKAEHGIPTSDGDNAFTTLQELLQQRDERRVHGMLGVIEDDRQVVDHTVTHRVAKTSLTQGAYLYVCPLEDMPCWMHLKNLEEYHMRQVEKARTQFTEVQNLVDSLDWETHK